MHPSITLLSPIHTFLCIIPSGGFTYCTYPHALGQLLRTIKWQYRRKIISKFQLAWTTCLKLTKPLLATFHNYFISACKLQLRDHTYTMIHFSQNQFYSHLQISKGTPVSDGFGMAAFIVWLESQVATHTFFIFSYKQTGNRDLLPLPKLHSFFYSLCGDIIQIYNLYNR